MELRDGKFYRDGVEVPPTFGDREQIELLRKAEKQMEKLEVDGIEAEIEYNVSAEVRCKCPCGRYVIFETVNNDDEDSANMYLDGMQQYCRCGREYEVVIDNYASSEAIIRLITDIKR